MPRKARYLKCSHCGVDYWETSHSKIDNALKGHNTYCSKICFSADMKAFLKARPPWYKKLSVDKKYSIRDYGPCPVCGVMYRSRTPKKYCSMKCYISTEEFQTRIREQAPRANLARQIKAGLPPLDKEPKTCLNCGKLYLAGRRRHAKYCSTTCYRLYQVGRFDRWIASPQTIALPQNYDEFLTERELQCLVEGCDWHGHFLTTHMNFAHGVQAREFKRAAGFNLGSGIVSLPLHELLCGRPHIKEAFKGVEHRYPVNAQCKNYFSLEGREHSAKEAALRSAAMQPIGETVCLGCGKKFIKAGMQYSKLYCSVDCRTAHYKATDKDRINTIMKCVTCGKDFYASSYQVRRLRKELLTGTCSLSCRQILNSPKGVGSHAKWSTVNAKV